MLSSLAVEVRTGNCSDNTFNITCKYPDVPGIVQLVIDGIVHISKQASAGMTEFSMLHPGSNNTLVSCRVIYNGMTYNGDAIHPGKHFHDVH